MLAASTEWAEDRARDMSDAFVELRRRFPAAERYVYLNNAGVCPLSTAAEEAMRAWLEEAREHGVTRGDRWEERVEAIRAEIAAAIGARPGEIAFVRSTSQGLGLVAEGLSWAPGDEVAVCTSLEYPSNVYPWQHLAARGVVVRAIEAEDGGVTAAAVARAITERTRLVSVSSVQYATGVATDLAAVSAVCKPRGVLLCVDGIQSVGAFPHDVEAEGIDFLAADSHKWMLGLNGIGFLYVRRSVLPRLRPVLVGWKSTTEGWNFDRAKFELRDDAAKLEEGSNSYVGLYGMGAGFRLLTDIGIDRVGERIRALVDHGERALTAIGCEVGPDRSVRRGTLTFTKPGVDQQALFEALAARGFVLSLRRGRVRVSPHAYNVEADLDRLAEAVAGFG